MTKRRERGENEFTRAAKEQAARTGRDVCDILKEMLQKALAAGERSKVAKIRRAQKYLGCRNTRKRRRRR
jgi:hypothetical protein